MRHYQKRYFVFWAYGSSAETREFFSETEMLECIRQHNERFGRFPDVLYGERLEFEPAQVVQSWKVKDEG